MSMVAEKSHNLPSVSWTQESWWWKFQFKFEGLRTGSDDVSPILKANPENTLTDTPRNNV